MNIDALYAVSALDGRYAEQLTDLQGLASEGALIRYRIIVEAAWLLHLGAGTPSSSGPDAGRQSVFGGIGSGACSQRRGHAG